MKPLGLATGGPNGVAGFAGPALLFQDAAVFQRHDLDEPRGGPGPFAEQRFGHGATRVLKLPLHQPLNQVQVLRFFQGLQGDHLHVAARREVAVPIVDIGDAAAHAGAEVAAGPAQDDDASAGHVLAAVVAAALDDGDCAAVAHREPLPRDAAGEQAAAGGAVKRDVADEDVLLRHERGAPRRVDDYLAARKPLSDVVVGVALQPEGDAGGQEGAEALAGGAVEADRDRIVGEAVEAVAAGQLAAQYRADGAVHVADRHLYRHGLAALEGGLGELQQLLVQRLLQAVVLCRDAVCRHLRPNLRPVEDGGEVKPLRLPLLDRPAHVQQVAAADHLLELAEAHLRHILAHLLGDEGEEADDVLRFALELLAQLGVLGRYADRAGVQVADAHHDATHDDEGRGGEAELLGAEEGRDHDVPSRLQLAVRLDDDAVAQVVDDERLLGLRQA